MSDYNVGVCRGCKACFAPGEERCPLRDDRDVLIEKITASDGIVLASPNYSFQVSAFTKIFLDRLGYLFHRPRFHGKTFTGIVVQGTYGGGKVVKYLEFVGGGLGFNVVRGGCIRTLSDSYYPTRLGPFKKAAGAVLDWAAARMFRPPAGVTADSKAS